MCNCVCNCVCICVGVEGGVGFLPNERLLCAETGQPVVVVVCRPGTLCTVAATSARERVDTHTQAITREQRRLLGP